MSGPDLFTYKPKAPVDVEAARKHGRECFMRLVGRHPMTREEKEGLRGLQIEQRRMEAETHE